MMEDSMNARVLNLELPYDLVSRMFHMETGQEVHLQGSTKLVTDVGIELERCRKETVRLTLSGFPEMLTMLGNTYQCIVTSVYDMQYNRCVLPHPTIKELPSDNVQIVNKTCKVMEDEINFKQNWTTTTKGNKDKDPTVISGSDVIRRSTRIRETNNDGIVKRLNLVRKRKGTRLTESIEMCSREDMLTELANKAETLINKTMHDIKNMADIEHLGNQQNVTESKNEQRCTKYPDDFTFTGMNLIEDSTMVIKPHAGDDCMKHNRSEVDESNNILKPDVDQISSECVKHEPKETEYGEQANETFCDKISSSDTGYFFAMREKQFISKSTKLMLEKLAFKCPLCKYAALNKNTFRYHLKSHHQLPWKAYRERYCANLTKMKSYSKDKNIVIGERDYEATSPHHIGNVELQEYKSEVLTVDDMHLTAFHRQRRKDTKPRKTYNMNKDAHIFVCELCNARYCAKGGLTMHLHTKHKDDPQSQEIIHTLKKEVNRCKSEQHTKCPFCDEICPGQRIFTHMKVSHIEEKRFHEFYKTTEKAYRQACYQKHREAYMSEQSCPYCGVGLKKCSMKRHIDNHCKMNDAKQKRFHCHLCSYYSTVKEDVLNHKAAIHTERHEYVCETCGSCYNTAVGLRQHARIKHQAVWKKPLQWWTCQDCNKQFSSRLNLDRHKPVHTREYRHVCGECGKKFKDPSSLVAHSRNMHKGTYRYKCDQCGHGMDRPQYLLTHKCERIRRQTNNTLLKKSIGNTEASNIYTTSSDEVLVKVGNIGTLTDSQVHTETVQIRVKESHTDNLQLTTRGLSLDTVIPLEMVQNQSIMDLGSEKSMSTELRNDSEYQYTLNTEHIQQQLGDNLTLVVHSSGEQVTISMSDIDGLQTEDGSVTSIQTEGKVIMDNGENVLVVLGTESELQGNNETVCENATVHDGATVILLSNSNTDHVEEGEMYAVLDTGQYI